uniref:Uncharacterized protein n=1 Tax=Schizaphis graminum TaxID=13262 RepID=A0A2S2PCZ4_SCHGA
MILLYLTILFCNCVVYKKVLTITEPTKIIHIFIQNSPLKAFKKQKILGWSYLVERGVQNVLSLVQYSTKKKYNTINTVSFKTEFGSMIESGSVGIKLIQVNTNVIPMFYL